MAGYQDFLVYFIVKNNFIYAYPWVYQRSIVQIQPRPEGALWSLRQAKSGIKTLIPEADFHACHVTPACQAIYEGTQSARTMPALRAALLVMMERP
jgi:hypothetical protein